MSARDERPRLAHPPTSVDFAPTPEEVEREWGPQAKEAMRAELHRRADRPVRRVPAPEDLPGAELNEGERQKVREAARRLTGG